MPATPINNDQMDWDRDHHGRMADYAEDPDHELTPDDSDDEKGI